MPKRPKPSKEFLRPVLFNENGNEIARIRTQLFIKRGKLENYLHQLEFFVGDVKKWRVVVRFNYWHGFSHKDVYNKEGEKIEREDLGRFVNLNNALKNAQNNLKTNINSYIRKFIKERK